MLKHDPSSLMKRAQELMSKSQALCDHPVAPNEGNASKRASEFHTRSPTKAARASPQNKLCDITCDHLSRIPTFPEWDTHT